MVNYLPVDINRVPYEFQVTLSNKEYTFSINYNQPYDFYFIDLSLGDEILVQGERVMYGVPLFNQLQIDADGNRDERFFSEIIYPYDLSETETRVSVSNLNDSVFLYIVDGSVIE